jgi:hypothetical protein
MLRGAAALYMSGTSLRDAVHPAHKCYHLASRDMIRTMIRTQISLTAEQMQRLRAEARRRRVPIAEVVRDAVDRMVPLDPEGRRARWERALNAAGRFDSGTGDVASDHDALAGDTRW